MIQYHNLFRMSTLHEELSTGRDSEEEERDQETPAAAGDSAAPAGNSTVPAGGPVATAESSVAPAENSVAPAESTAAAAGRQLSSSHSLTELGGAKASHGSPSIVSSGYGSQAASSSNLSSEDSCSVKSISVDETPESETVAACDAARLLQLEPGAASVSPGEETDGDQATLTTETEDTSPSSTTITPSTSREAMAGPGEPEPCPPSLLAPGDSCAGDPAAGVPEADAGEGCSLPAWLVVGERVLVAPSLLPATVAFVGSTQFAPGTWVGLQLDSATGKHNGTVKGVAYFECPQRRGMFVRARNVKQDKRSRETHLRSKIKVNNDVFDKNHRPCSKSKIRTK